MKGALILALIAAALALVSFLRLGVQVRWNSDQLTLRAWVGPVRLTLLPRTGRRRRKQPPRQTPSAPPKGRGDMLEQLRRMLPLVAEAAGHLRRKVRLDRIELDVTAAAPDPASAALAFGGINAAVGMIWPMVEQNFNVKDRNIRTRVDFEADKPTASLNAEATLTVGQALALAVWLAPRLPQAMGKERGRSRTDTAQKEAV